jgi:hypothetical protein
LLYSLKCFHHFCQAFHDIYSLLGFVPASTLLVLRPVRHLRRGVHVGVDGIVVALYNTLNVPVLDFNITVTVVPVQSSTVSYTLDDDPPTFSVPILMLLPAITCPLAVAVSATLDLPLFGLPYSDRAVVLQVRRRNSYARTASRMDCRVGSHSAYASGDFFELPVSSAQILIPVYFVCALADSRTKTWLVRYDVVLTLHSYSHFVQGFWCLSDMSNNVVYLVVPVIQTFNVLGSLQLRNVCIFDASHAASPRHPVFPTYHLRLLLRQATQVSRADYTDLRHAGHAYKSDAPCYKR